MMNENFKYKDIIEEYNNGNLKISVELAKTRSFLMQDTIYSTRLYFWTFINTLLIPLLILILSIIQIGFLGGIIYFLIAMIFYFSIQSTASINIEQAVTTSAIYAIIAFLVEYFANINMNYTILLTVLQYISICFFYKYIGTIFIKKILFVSEEWFYRLYGELFYIHK